MPALGIWGDCSQEGGTERLLSSCSVWPSSCLAVGLVVMMDWRQRL